MELWVPITVAAALLQTVRSALQKRLLGPLSTNGATYCRFVYALPFAVAYPMLLVPFSDTDIPAPNVAFAVYVGLGGIAQIVGTALLVHLFSLRNFATAIAYSKTETVQAAVFSIVILGEALTVSGASAIVVSFVGVVLVSLARRTAATMWTRQTALFGLLTGALLGLSAVCYRAASLALDEGGFLIRAATTLAWAVVLQTIVMGAWLRARAPGELTRVARCLPRAWPVGLSGMLGSAAWFTAMTLQNAAYVRAVGQIELVFAFAASVLFFRERPTGGESLGILLIVVGVLALVA